MCGHQRGEQQENQAERLVRPRYRKGSPWLDEQQVVAEDRDHGGADGWPTTPAACGQHDRHEIQQDRRGQIDDGRVEQADNHEGRQHAKQPQQMLDDHAALYSPSMPEAHRIDLT